MLSENNKLITYILKFPENKFIEHLNTFSPIIKYIGIIITWYNLTNNSDENYFFSVFEKKICIEVFLLSMSFILIALGRNSKKESVVFKLYIGISFFIFIALFFGLWEDKQLLASGLIILISNLLNFLSQSNEYGTSANDVFMSGRGAVFSFVIAVLYGLPIGLIIQKYDLNNNQSIMGVTIIFYYIILISFEIRYLLKRDIKN